MSKCEEALNYIRSYHDGAKNPRNYSEIRENTNFGDRGWVYLIQCGDFPYFKIGMTSNHPSVRLDAMKTNTPFELKLIAALAMADRYKAERRLHSKFKNRWHKGEWFTFDALSLHEVISEMENIAAEQEIRKAGDEQVLLNELSPEREVAG